MKSKDIISTDDLPRGLPEPARRALAGAGVTELQQLERFSEADLRRLHGMGEKGMRLLKEALIARGLRLIPARRAKHRAG
jgi:hypothetical protein